MGPVNRRTALKLMAASAALSAGACGRQPETIVPYVNMPERLVPGEPLAFATAVTLAGIAQPVIGQTFDGRPTKLEPNVDHPAAAGSDAFTQAAILSLYDPDRSKAVRKGADTASWDGFAAEFLPRIEGHRAKRGEGLRILTGPSTSPTFFDQISTLLDRFPEARWHQWDPLGEENVLAGTELAFGRRLKPVYRFDRARCVLSLDADFLGAGPEQTLNAARFGAARRVWGDKPEGFLRLHVIEPVLSLTGSNADHRLAVRRGRVAELAQMIAARFGADNLPEGRVDENARVFVERLVQELSAHRGQALVVAGAAQPAEVHALAHWLNAQHGGLGETVEFLPVDNEAPSHLGLRELVEEIDAGNVETLLISGTNPVYSAPGDFDLADLLGKVPFSVHHGLYRNETAARTTWHLPALHDLESWSDARAADGTVTLLQPLITPLFRGRSLFSVLGAFFGELDADDREVLRAHWRRASGAGDFETWWRKSLRAGFVEGSAPQSFRPSAVAVPKPVAPAVEDDGYELVFRPDTKLWDGDFANNAWLQELPDPVTKLVWGNAALVSPRDALNLGIEDGNLLDISLGESRLMLAAMVAVGQAEGSIGLALGYGRPEAGVIGSAVGVDVNPLRRLDALWHATGAQLRAMSDTGRLIRTQEHSDMEGREIIRDLSFADFLHGAEEKNEEVPPSLYPDWDYPDAAWGMVIDQSVCIGCSACVTACQSENNIPVVGPEEVERGREMHWIRIDRYFRGEPDAAEVLFQPVPCMHCEKAPCEPVCPVEASVHDREGLNVQVYNRCIGTRFCQANCPYKVRRFNFYGYGDEQAYENLDDPLYHAAANPDVSVRSRGVMEKCTYCVQRISRAQQRADREGRELEEGEVRTACQNACPTQAIAFGDINRKDSLVSQLKGARHEYDLLGELGTRPRTSYLARIRAEAASTGSGRGEGA
ncbi:4Fe-4S dicluster domain-containing protein [Afifella aestuarii]|uniref:4Fe-4S dicluster domain-containing protein n=1 Tax=Afifella aestuarii TaxID=1909496 RepID=UPI000FE43859|nr:4Fe-4S dicluster domain-containing protein [Afifella aestuarii]